MKHQAVVLWQSCHLDTASTKYWCQDEIQGRDGVKLGWNLKSSGTDCYLLIVLMDRGG